MADAGKTPEELEAEIARPREQLAETVDELTAKLDVKGQAQHKGFPRMGGIRQLYSHAAGLRRGEVLHKPPFPPQCSAPQPRCIAGCVAAS